MVFKPVNNLICNALIELHENIYCNKKAAKKRFDRLAGGGMALSETFAAVSEAGVSTGANEPFPSD